MLVYGDIERSEAPAAVATEVDRRLQAVRAMEPGIARHQALVAAFIRAAELVQGVADADFAARGMDAPSPAQAAGSALLVTLAKAIMASWDSRFAYLPPAPGDWQGVLGQLVYGDVINTRGAEGYSYYALYPESYGLAARRSGLAPDTTVIGIRSIGTGLAAMVSVALGVSGFHTVRPMGHPFRRTLAVDEAFGKTLLAGSGDFAIVDEGPGLSGSSFNCVADWLVAHGIGEERIHFFASHAGDLGTVASIGHRLRWSTAARHVADAEPVLQEPGRGLARWIATLTGPLDGPLEEVSGGAWRDRGPAALAPPVDAAAERRKFIATAGGRRWLAKFAGLGARGEAQLGLAHALADAGFAPEPLGLCHGFLVLPWVDAVPTGGGGPNPARILDYLAFRSALPAPGPGAPLDTLFAMAAHNLGEQFGPATGAAVRQVLGDAGRFARLPCCTDNRMHPWEWVHGASGWLKLDGTDHHAAHDLVGCQDICWDLAGAAVEFNLSEEARDGLADALSARSGRKFDRDFVAVHELCYLGFQVGLWSMALTRAAEPDRPLIASHLERYRQRPVLLQILDRA